ncbi:MAG: ABC transporter ATP-binding protein [Desulfovibrio sp.]|nr:MAG: ABC transporter ATP-binding protein [Desulfovibrio sp.]
MLEMKNVDAYYGNIQALHDVTLTIGQGEIITLIGANGAGKSTTLMAICGVVPIQGGEILFEGKPINGMRPDEIVSLGVSQAPEGRLIFPDLTVTENLDMGAFQRTDKAEIKRDMEHIFELFPILAERRRQPGGTLSGGEQQMLATSRALMARPRILLLDEPSMGLAPMVIKQIFEVISRINQEDRTTIFLVEQNANIALQVAHRGYVMENGRITMTNTGANLLEDEAVKTAYLGI